MIDVIKKALLAGVGAAVVTKEKVQDALDDFVKQGKVSAGDAKIMAEKISEQGKKEFEEVSAKLSAKISEYTAKADKDLKAAVTALEARVKVLEAKLAEEAKRSNEP